MTTQDERARILFESGKYREAIPLLESLARENPELARYPSNLCYLHGLLGEHRKAITCGRKAISLEPDFVEAYVNLGICLQQSDQLDDAEVIFKTGLNIAPDSAALWTNLGLVHFQQGAIAEARRCHETAIYYDPVLVESYCNLGLALLGSMQAREALRCFRHALTIKPNHSAAISNYLMSQQYLPDLMPDDMRSVASRIAYSYPKPDNIKPYSYSSSGENIRIGFVSADFYKHPVGYFLKGLLKKARESGLEFYCYANQSTQDSLTVILQDCATNWSNIQALTDREVADLIHEQQIDLLIDLSGHTTGNRLGVFNYRPAPSQASWLGFFGSTGMPAIDTVLLSEDQAEEGAEAFYSENLHRLRCCQFNYIGDEKYSIENLLPSERNGKLTLGCFNNPAKINFDVMQTWADILNALTDSRLVLKWKTYADTETTEFIAAQFQGFGLAPDRLELREASPHDEMMLQYNDIDIALDPFPFSGALSTSEALWMGVPVVSLKELRPVSRQSYSILKSLQLEHHAVSTPAEYVRVVTELAADTQLRSQLRRTLRQRMIDSEAANSTKLLSELQRFALILRD